MDDASEDDNTLEDVTTLVNTLEVVDDIVVTDSMGEADDELVVSEVVVTADDSEVGCKDGVTKLDDGVLSMLWVGVGVAIVGLERELDITGGLILKSKNIVVSEYGSLAN